MKKRFLIFILLNFVGLSILFPQSVGFPNNEQNPYVRFNSVTRGIRFLEWEGAINHQPTSYSGWPSVEFIHRIDIVGRFHWFNEMEQPAGTTAIHGFDNFWQPVISLSGIDADAIIQSLISQFEQKFNIRAREYNGWVILPYIEYIRYGDTGVIQTICFFGAFIWQDNEIVKIFLHSLAAG